MVRCLYNFLLRIITRCSHDNIEDESCCDSYEYNREKHCLHICESELSKTIGPVGRADENLSGPIVSSKTSVQKFGVVKEIWIGMYKAFGTPRQIPSL